jgi:hypothetical protein
VRERSESDVLGVADALYPLSFELLLSVRSLPRSRSVSLPRSLMRSLELRSLVVRSLALRSLVRSLVLDEPLIPLF